MSLRQAAILALSVALGFVLSAPHAFAQDAQKPAPPTDTICKWAQVDTGERVSALAARLKAGADPSGTLACALEAGYSIEQIVLGGVDGGLPLDVLTYYLVQLGVDPAAMAETIQKKIGVTPDAAASGSKAIEEDLPPRDSSKSVSPSDF